MKTVTPSLFACSKMIGLILLFALGSGTIVGCADIIPIIPRILPWGTAAEALGIPRAM